MSGGSGPSTALPMASPTNSGAAARKPRQASLSSSLNIRIAVFLTAFADYDNDWLVQNSTTHSSAQKRSFPPSLEMKAQCPPYLGATSAIKGFSSIPIASFRNSGIEENPFIALVAPKYGGHCAFILSHARDAQFWGEEWGAEVRRSQWV